MGFERLLMKMTYVGFLTQMYLCNKIVGILLLWLEKDGYKMIPML
jgi:hypothetical protein